MLYYTQNHTVERVVVDSLHLMRFQFNWSWVYIFIYQGASKRGRHWKKRLRKNRERERERQRHWQKTIQRQTLTVTQACWSSYLFCGYVFEHNNLFPLPLSVDSLCKTTQWDSNLFEGVSTRSHAYQAWLSTAIQKVVPVATTIVAMQP